MIEPEADIVVACQKRERAAQQTLFEQCHAGVYRLCVRMVSEQDASDLTQQVFIRVFRAIEGFTGRSRFSTWLYRVTVNECLQHLRSRQRTREVSLTYEPEGQSVQHSAEHRELLDMALQRLEPELRTIFVLREVERLSYSALAETLNLTEGTVGSRLNRARSQLREFLVELGWEP